MPPAPLCTSSHSAASALLPPPKKPAASPSFPARPLPIHGFIPPSNLCRADSVTDTSILSALLHCTRTGRMRDARELFDTMPEKTPVAWTILMSGYALHGPAAEAFSLFRSLHEAGLRPDPFDVSIILGVCASLCRPNHGKELHCYGLKAGHLEDLFVANGLVTMYARCGLLRFSGSVFWGIQQPDLVSWTAMLAALTNNGDGGQVLRLLERMAWAGIELDAHVFSIGLKASAITNCVHFGTQIHCCAVKRGLDSHSFLGTSLLEFYGRVGELDLMRMLFDRLFDADLVAWNAMISCYASNLRDEEALVLFQAMIKNGFLCDGFTLGSVLQAVTSLEALNHGREIHGFTIRAGFELNRYVNSALLDMYINCDKFENAKIPLKLFAHIQSMGAELDVFIVSSILKSCASRKDLETGKTLHSYAVKLGLNSDAFVTCALIDMYAKCGLIRASISVFAGIAEPCPASWSAIIAGSISNGYFHEALELFRLMQFRQSRANEFTYTSVILACSAEKMLGGGKEIHCSLIRNGYGCHASVVAALINLYTGLRESHKALALSYFIPAGDVPWVSLIRAFAISKEHRMVLWLFHKLQKSNGRLDDNLSASYVLDSCTNPQFLDAGIQIHAYIIKRGLVSETSTNNSLINMYSRCGTISDAGYAFEQIPEKNADSWTSIISANVDHGCPSEALRQFRQMIGKDKYPDCRTFLSVLKACWQLGLVEEAFRLFIYMIEVYKIKPSIETYSCMVEVLSSAGMFREAEHFIEASVPFESNALAWRTVLSTSIS